MKDQPIERNQQNLIKTAHRLVIWAIIFSLLYIFIVLFEGYTGNHMTSIYASLTIWVGVLEILFQTIILFIILRKTNGRLKNISFCFLILSFFLIIVDIFNLVLSSESRSYPLFFILDIAEFVLFFVFYQKVKGKQPAPQLAYGLFAAWILIYAIYIFGHISDIQNVTFVVLVIITYLIAYLAPFVLCWIACMSVVHEGFYKSFIEARY